MADSRGVEKAVVCLFALKKGRRDETRSSLAPFLHTLKQRQYGLLHAILGCIIRDKVILLLQHRRAIISKLAQIYLNSPG